MKYLRQDSLIIFINLDMLGEKQIAADLKKSLLLKGMFAKFERGFRLNAIKSAFDRYYSYKYTSLLLRL